MNLYFEYSRIKNSLTLDLVFCSFSTPCGNHGNLLSHFFFKNFVKATFLLKKSLKSWFDEMFFFVRVNSTFFHTVFYLPNLWQLAAFVRSDKFTEKTKLFTKLNSFVKLLKPECSIVSFDTILPFLRKSLFKYCINFWLNLN